jgi:peptidoglycan hydrolase-like protein with peptidoglycan-binding domain
LCAGQDIAIDGDFGPQTEKAVKNVQAFFRITVDGVVGSRQTWPIIDYLAVNNNPGA